MKPTSYGPSTATLAVIVFGLALAPVAVCIGGFYLICWMKGWTP